MDHKCCFQGICHVTHRQSHTSHDCFLLLRVCFSIFFLLSGVLLCRGNCLLRCTEKETARQRQYHFTHTNKPKAVAAAPPQFFTPFISASNYLATKQTFSIGWIPKCHCSGHGTQYSGYFCHFVSTFDTFQC